MPSCTLNATDSDGTKNFIEAQYAIHFGLAQTNWSGANAFEVLKEKDIIIHPQHSFATVLLSTSLSGQKEVAKPFRIMKNKHIINLHGNRCCFCINYHVNSRDAQLC